MTFCRKSVTVAALVVWTVVAQSLVYGATPSGPKPFVVLDATGYTNKPDLLTYGVHPVTIVGPQDFDRYWYLNPTAVPSMQSVQAAGRIAKLKGNPVMLDIEHWFLNTPTEVQTNLSKFLNVLSWFRSVAPGLSIAYYAIPIRDYWNAQYPVGTPQRQIMMTRDDRIQSLIVAVDVMYPSLYTFYPDQVGWTKYAIANIEEARRVAGGKPVYAVIWPQYHGSNKTLGYQYLPQDYWKLQLQTARQYADGLVLWGGWTFPPGLPAQRVPWNEQAPWWITTKAFLKNLQTQTPPAPPTGLTVR